MKIESLINEAYSKIMNKEIKFDDDRKSHLLEFDDFVLVCTEASKYILNSMHGNNTIKIIEYGFENDCITFYIDKFISTNPIFEKYNISVESFEDYFEYGKKRQKYPVIRTKIVFPIDLLFEKQITLKRAKN